MTAAGGSAAARAAQLRANARRGLWRRLLAWLDLSPTARRADAQAAAWDAGAEGERRTAVLLSVLEREGWTVLHDRLAPGARAANVDDTLISPGGRAFVVDTKLWSSRWPVMVAGGRLMHGARDRDRPVDAVLYETGLVSRALGVPVQPVIAVHNAPVAGDGFIVRDVPVVPAVRLVELLRGNDGPRNPAAAAGLVRKAVEVLPPYLG